MAFGARIYFGVSKVRHFIRRGYRKVKPYGWHIDVTPQYRISSIIDHHGGQTSQHRNNQNIHQERGCFCQTRCPYKSFLALPIVIIPKWVTPLVSPYKPTLPNIRHHLHTVLSSKLGSHQKYHSPPILIVVVLTSSVVASFNAKLEHI
jgi:hypothetical protein